MRTLKRVNGVWYANGRPYQDLHSAIEALKG